jgi:surfactin synthase thioesterase subunit
LSSDISAIENDGRVITKTVAAYQEDLKKTPLKEGEQFNLAGYSYGSVLQAQVALELANSGQVVDNLILIGSPISDKSDLYKQLSENKNIKNILRYDFKGGKLSNPRDVFDFIQGGLQGLTQGNNAHHFDAARPGAEVDKLMNTIVEWLQQQG